MIEFFILPSFYFNNKIYYIAQKISVSSSSPRNLILFHFYGYLNCMSDFDILYMCVIG